jgi:hypothetical protein
LAVKKLILIIVMLVTIAGVLVFAYLSPTIAFHNIEATVAANSVDKFSEEIDQTSVAAHLRNQMSLQMQNALRSYRTRPDPAATEIRLAPYFERRSTALATPAFLLRELVAQLRGNDSKIRIRFTGLSEARVHWNAGNKSYEALLSRQGFVWKLSALDVADAMPRYWDQPTTLLGTYYQSHFENCCIGGQSSETPYNGLRLATAIDIIDIYPDSDAAWNMTNVSEVQISADAKMVANLKYDDTIEVHCKQLWQGNTGHYALPTYCVADEIKRAN